MTGVKRSTVVGDVSERVKSEGCKEDKRGRAKVGQELFVARLNELSVVGLSSSSPERRRVLYESGSNSSREMSEGRSEKEEEGEIVARENLAQRVCDSMTPECLGRVHVSSNLCSLDLLSSWSRGAFEEVR